ncbi:hypothetical protein Atc_m224 (plasmid) [Acidithiobacillus caldus SM-1]|uniref:Uncharacterized protein n=1 Tax=Acidithiobacillus caldus (strain SM-1) TaxID=990288 RepID=F9ZUB3_ACICS|nr:hypothetical protein Atc_m224 [Acidithiobacillus caldus SM-1]
MGTVWGPMWVLIAMFGVLGKYPGSLYNPYLQVYDHFFGIHVGF